MASIGANKLVNPKSGPVIAPIEIDWYGEQEEVNVTPRDQQRFNVQKDRVIAMLQLAQYAEAQLHLLLNRLGEWMRAQSQHVAQSYLTVRDAGFFFVVIQKTSECNDELEDALSDLDLSVANDSDLDRISMNVIALPPVSPDSLNSFLDDRFMVAFRGKRT